MSEGEDEGVGARGGEDRDKQHRHPLAHLEDNVVDGARRVGEPVVPVEQHGHAAEDHQEGDDGVVKRGQGVEEGGDVHLAVAPLREVGQRAQVARDPEQEAKQVEQPDHYVC